MAESAIETLTLTWNDFEYGTESKGFFSDTTSINYLDRAFSGGKSRIRRFWMYITDKLLFQI